MSSIKRMLFVLTGLLVFVCLPVLAEETTSKQTTLTTAPSTTVESQTTPAAEEPLETPEEAVTVSPGPEAQEEEAEVDTPASATPEQAADETPETTAQAPEGEAADPEPPKNLAEVFVDSNALNSTISIEMEDEIVSGPGNKVLAVIPAGARFRMITEAAEGSEPMAVSMMVKTKDGAAAPIEPLSEEGNAQVYQMPENAEGIAGAVFFGNAEENTEEEAQAFVAASVSDTIAKQTIVNSEEKLETAGARAARSEVSEISEAPSTGIEDVDYIPLFLCTLMIAGVTLWSRKRLN